MERENWILVRETALAKEIGPKAAGWLFKKAGVAKKKISMPGLRGTHAVVDKEVKYLSKDDVVARIAGKISPSQPSQDASYQELVETVEHLNRLVEELRQENCQLRQHLALKAGSNGLGDRARKALSAAKRTLEIYQD